CDSAADEGEARACQQYAAVIAEFLDAAGLGHVVLSDGDVTAERLQGRKLVILPYNPAVPEAVVDELAGFIKAGGKLIASYVLPGRLQPLVGIRAGRHVQQEYRGYFASIRAGETPLKGAPASAAQASWNIHEAGPIDGKARVAAWWYTDKGESTKLPAVVVSDNAVFLTHVMLADDREAKQQLLLAMVGGLLPEAWDEAARGRFRQIGRFEPYDGYDAAEAGIRKQAEGNKPALAELSRAVQLRSKAHLLVEGGRYVEAIAAAGEARAVLLRAHCLAQRPLAGEHRGIWCHSAFGVAGMTWDEAIKLLADNGFTAVLPNMLWGGVAFYQSDVLPVAPQVAETGDQVALCLAACRKYGVECHVWKVNWNMGSRTPRAFAEGMKAAGRTQVKPDGSPNDRWLCPSHPLNRKLEIDSMVEVARKYDVHGVHFDYIRYPGREGCYCDGCRSRFEASIGRKVDRWPADLALDGPLHEKWMDFRREQITAVVAAVAEQARKARPGVKISAAVFRDWPSDRDTVGQDWKVWCDRGYLDFVCPMDYTPHDEHFRGMVERQLPWAGKVPCYPGIGVSVWSDPTDVARLIRQIGIARELGTKGFTLFNYDPAVAREVLPMLGLGMTKRK
ncbi:MAG TPA: family 10 glycosylhydrolase, partial [Phycisphaerae bacterium]|nr:family 10 glycosylhydrolase [Phycisphaerae bacterium]